MRFLPLLLIVLLAGHGHGQVQPVQTQSAQGLSAVGQSPQSQPSPSGDGTTIGSWSLTPNATNAALANSLVASQSATSTVRAAAATTPDDRLPLNTTLSTTPTQASQDDNLRQSVFDTQVAGNPPSINARYAGRASWIWISASVIGVLNLIAAGYVIYATRPSRDQRHGALLLPSLIDITLTLIVGVSLIHGYMYDRVVQSNTTCTALGFSAYGLIAMDAMFLGYAALMTHLTLRRGGSLHAMREARPWWVWALLIALPWIGTGALLSLRSFGADGMWCYISPLGDGGRIASIALSAAHVLLLPLILLPLLPLLRHSDPLVDRPGLTATGRLTAYHHLLHLAHYLPIIAYAFSTSTSGSDWWVYLVTILSLLSGSIIRALLISIVAFRERHVPRTAPAQGLAPESAWQGHNAAYGCASAEALLDVLAEGDEYDKKGKV